MSLLTAIKDYFIRENTVIKYNDVVISESFAATYDAISVISRCVDLIVDNAAQIEFKIVKDTGNFDIPATHKYFEKILNTPSTEFNRYDFFRTCYSDLIFRGNTLLYNLGTEFQHLYEVEYSSDNKPVRGVKRLDEDRLIHTRLLAEYGSRFGKPYLTRIDKELDLIVAMLNFQKNMFKNNGIPGIILKSENPLSQKQKERIAEEFLNMYSIMRGHSGKPFIADNNLDIRTLTHNLKELEFDKGVDSITKRICSALGVPEVLLSSGNNANISPNVKLFIFNTVAPFVTNLAAGLTLHLHKFYKGTDKLKVVPNYNVLPLLAEDVLKQTNSIKGLVTSGVITPNEARAKLHYQKHSDPLADELLFPANITGALNNPSPGVPNEE